MQIQAMLPELYDLLHHSKPRPWPDVDDPWWETRQAADLMKTTHEDLSRLAPEGYYFGGHPNDLSAIGYWKCLI